jgi:hypothetical protein
MKNRRERGVFSGDLTNLHIYKQIQLHKSILSNRKKARG